MCGEQAAGLPGDCGHGGSPPRVRGTGINFRSFPWISRITPACAGNSQFLVFCQQRLQDHPRVCGEQGNIWYHSKHGIGSPPRVRGTGKGRAPGGKLLRITPACAGNSRPPTRCSPASRDHPRVCGEQLLAEINFKPLWGSPPRVRGTDGYMLHMSRKERITPACAGNS